MKYPAKIQQITRKDFNQYYINFPRVIAMVMEFSNGDPVEWEIADKDAVILKRKKEASVAQKEFKPRIYYDFSLESLVPENPL